MQTHMEMLREVHKCKSTRGAAYAAHAYGGALALMCVHLLALTHAHMCMGKNVCSYARACQHSHTSTKLLSSVIEPLAMCGGVNTYMCRGCHAYVCDPTS